jgi:hypothetical protein
MNEKVTEKKTAKRGIETHADESMFGTTDTIIISLIDFYKNLSVLYLLFNNYALFLRKRYSRYLLRLIGFSNVPITS